jgi:GPH family glycoside/pentoside/hexuronide:cation symporter
VSDDEGSLKTLIDEVEKGYVDYAIVGNEEVHVKQLTAAQEVTYIQEVKQKLAGKVPVGTVEPDRELLAHPELMRASDLVLANIPPISYGVTLAKSLDYIKSEYAQLVQAAAGTEVGIGETEWPSAGFGSTVQEEAKYFVDVEAWSRAQNVKTFYFEAFDEPWLGQFNAVGAHWGLWTADLQLKPGIDAVFAKP